MIVWSFGDDAARGGGRQNHRGLWEQPSSRLSLIQMPVSKCLFVYLIHESMNWTFSIWAAGALLSVCRGENAAPAGRSSPTSLRTYTCVSAGFDLVGWYFNRWQTSLMWWLQNWGICHYYKSDNWEILPVMRTWRILFQDAACLHLDTIYVLRIRQEQWLSWQCTRCLSAWAGPVGGGCSGRRAQSQNTGWAIKLSTRQWPSRRPAAAAATFKSAGTAPHVSALSTGAMLCKKYKVKEQIFNTNIAFLLMKL